MKKITIAHACIATSDSSLVTGREYQYKEGAQVSPVRVNQVQIKEGFLEVKLTFLETGEYVTVSHTLEPIAYMGMWRIFDKGHFDLEKNRAYLRYLEGLNLDGIETLEFD